MSVRSCARAALSGRGERGQLDEDENSHHNAAPLWKMAHWQHIIEEQTFIHSVDIEL